MGYISSSSLYGYRIITIQTSFHLDIRFILKEEEMKYLNIVALLLIAGMTCGCVPEHQPSSPTTITTTLDKQPYDTAVML